MLVVAAQWRADPSIIMPTRLCTLVLLLGVSQCVAELSPDRSTKSLGDALFDLARAEEQKNDPYLTWLFATAAAEVEPGRQKMAEYAVQATARIVPALATSFIDSVSASRGGDPAWLTVLRQKLVAHMAKLPDRAYGETRSPLPPKLARLPPPLVASTFATVVARWHFDDDDAYVLAEAAESQFDDFVKQQPAGTHPLRLNNDFFDHQMRQEEAGRPIFAHLAAYQRLEKRFRAAAAQMLIEHGLPEDEAVCTRRPNHPDQQPAPPLTLCPPPTVVSGGAQHVDVSMAGRACTKPVRCMHATRICRRRLAARSTAGCRRAQAASDSMTRAAST